MLGIKALIGFEPMFNSYKDYPLNLSRIELKNGATYGIRTHEYFVVQEILSLPPERKEKRNGECLNITAY